MITKVQKWGNSQGLHLSQELLAHVEIEIGDEVEVAIQEGSLVITPIHRMRGKYNLQELVQRIPKDYKPSEENWGPPSGKEFTKNRGNTMKTPLSRETIHTLVDHLPETELETAGKFLEFLASRNTIEEIDDSNEVLRAKESLADSSRFSLESVLKEAGLQ